MDRWKEDFIVGLKQGRPVDQCARLLAGMPLQAVYLERQADPDFAIAWDLARPSEDNGDLAIADGRLLTPAALEALMWSQCDDEEAAAYFGMEVGEFKAAVAEDEKLTKIYRVAPLGGKAALKRSQFEKAMSGDGSMLGWLGKQHLGQADKVENTIKRGDDDSPEDLARKLMYIMAQGGGDALAAIDVDAEEIEEVINE